MDLKTDENGDTYWEIDFTKGYMGYEVLREKNVSYSESLLKGEPFTVVKFLTKSAPSSAVQDNDLTEYRNSIKPEPKKDKNRRTRTAIGQPPHVGDVLLIKVKDKLYECEIEDEEVFDRNPSLFSARIYPLDKEDKKLLENDGDRIISHSAKRKYERVTVKFSYDPTGFKNGKTNWEYDFTKGMIKSHWNEILDGEQPFTVVKFLTKSIPSSAVQDNDLTEYKPSIKPLKEDYRNVFNPSQAIGEPVEDGDTFLIEAADKSFKCEIHETDDLFKNHQNLFTARIYPLDKDDVSIAYEDYFEVVLIFDQHLENHDHYVIDFTKGKISPVDYIPIIREDTPFTVTKFLAHSGKNSTVQDNDLTNYRNSINQQDLNDLPFAEKMEFIGKPIKKGDVVLIKADNKLYECKINHDDNFKSSIIYSVRVYPLDKNDKELVKNDRFTRKILEKDYVDGLLIFNSIRKEEKDGYHITVDYSKGEIRTNSYIDDLGDLEGVPFTVVKILSHAIPNTAVKDHNLDLTYISQDLKIFIKQCLEFKELLEEHREAIEECIEDDQRSVELDGYDGEDPVESPNKKYLEMITFCIDDVEYNIDELIDQIRKR